MHVIPTGASRLPLTLDSLAAPLTLLYLTPAKHWRQPAGEKNNTLSTAAGQKGGAGLQTRAKLPTVQSTFLSETNATPVPTLGYCFPVFASL